MTEICLCKCCKLNTVKHADDICTDCWPRLTKAQRKQMAPLHTHTGLQKTMASMPQGYSQMLAEQSALVAAGADPEAVIAAAEQQICAQCMQPAEPNSALCKECRRHQTPTNMKRLQLTRDYGRNTQKLWDRGINTVMKRTALRACALNDKLCKTKILGQNGKPIPRRWRDLPRYARGRLTSHWDQELRMAIVELVESLTDEEIGPRGRELYELSEMLGPERPRPPHKPSYIKRSINFGPGNM
jgi:hypothetical protein